MFARKLVRSAFSIEGAELVVFSAADKSTRNPVAVFLRGFAACEISLRQRPTLNNPASYAGHNIARRTVSRIYLEKKGGLQDA